MAQLDRATVCGTVGRRFESSWARHFLERWPRGRRRLTRNQLYPTGTVGSNPTLSASVTLDLNLRNVGGIRTHEAHFSAAFKSYMERWPSG